MSHPLQANVQNRLLAALPAAEFALVSQHLDHTEFAAGEILHRAGDVISYVYFVESGLISALTTLSDGRPLEVGLIGFEGIAGISVVLRAAHSHSEMVCQAGGSAYRIPAVDL